MKNLFPLKLTALLTASLACLSASLLTKSEAAPAQTAPATVRLPGHVSPNILLRSTLLGRKTGTDRVPLALALPLRDPAGLEKLLQRQYTPGDPLFHHFITPEEFTSRFSPTAQTYAAVAAFAQAKGLTVTQTHSTRLLLNISGPASAVEAAFQVHLRNFESPEGRVFHAPDAEPAIPAALAGKIAGVIGLQNSAVWRSHAVRRRGLPQTIGTPIGTGVGGGLTPNDIKAAYNLSTTPLTGKGQTLGLYEADGYSPSDITTYASSFGLPLVPLQNVLVDGATGVPSASDNPGEVTLDIELMMALAPGATAIYVYETPNDGPGILAGYAQIADDDAAKEISTSWGETENNLPAVFSQAENTIFLQMAMQGQSIYAAAGDTGAYDDTRDLSVDDPASQPHVVGVGGTSLNVVSAGGAYESEAAWSDPTPEFFGSPKGSGGGGGISDVWMLPDYQNTVSALASMPQRNVPDVSLDADPNTGYSIFYSGGFTVFGGTSCAAPLWAAFTALVNEQRETNGEADLGFPNPTIYQIAQGPHYNSAFHDIRDRSNNLFYQALPGYDNATGWGSFNGAGLIAQMAPAIVANANPVSSLSLAPPTVVGGLTSAATVTLANPAPDGGASVTVTLGGGPATVAAPTVVVAAGATTADFIVSTSAVTASTPVSVTASYLGGSRTAILTVTAPPVTITPLSLTLSPDTVGGGAPSTGTVTLTGPAPAGGLSVALTSSSGAATVPTSVAVPAGAVSASFPIASASVTVQTVVTLTAALNGATQTATLTVQAPELEPIVLMPSSVIGGDTAAAALTLTFPAPAGGAVITLTGSSPAAAVVPASVTIPAGQTTVSVPITTSAVAVTQAVTLTAAYGGVTKTAKLTVKAALLNGLSLAPPSVIGGAATVATLSLGSNAPSDGLTATLSSSDPAAQVPATLTIPPGATSVSVVVTTAFVSAPVQATLTADLGTSKQTALLSIQPVQIASLTLAPTSVITGTPATGILSLNAPAPAGGLSVTLKSSGAAATVPATLLVPAGTARATFTAATPHPGSAVLSASLAGTAQTATLTVSGEPGTTYPAGLNLLSAPYDYSGMGLDSLFGYTGVLLAAEQPSTGAYAFSPAAPADALHLGRGYWVNLPHAVTLSTVGTPAPAGQDFSVALSPGWNQIGQPYTTSETLGSLNVSAGGSAVSFDQASAAAPLLVSSLVYRYAPGSGATAAGYVWVRDTDTLQPGLGYWIYAYQAVTLVFPHH